MKELNFKMVQSVSTRHTSNDPELLFDSVVILSPFYWNFMDDMWQTTHHVAREFSRFRPTLLVEPFRQWNPGSGRDFSRVDRLAKSLMVSRMSSPPSQFDRVAPQESSVRTFFFGARFWCGAGWPRPEAGNSRAWVRQAAFVALVSGSELAAG